MSKSKQFRSDTHKQLLIRLPNELVELIDKARAALSRSRKVYTRTAFIRDVLWEKLGGQNRQTIAESESSTESDPN